MQSEKIYGEVYVLLLSCFLWVMWLAGNWSVILWQKPSLAVSQALSQLCFHPAPQALQAKGIWGIRDWGIPVKHRLPQCKDSGHLGDDTNPFFSMSFPMQNQCQINYTQLFCEKGSVAMKVFASNMRLQKLSTKKEKSEKKMFSRDYWQTKCKRQLWRSCQRKKDWILF